MVGGGQGGVIRSILARQFLGFGDNGCKLLPGQNRLDGGEGIGADVVRLDQRFTQFGQKPHLVVDRPSIDLQRLGCAAFRPTKEPPDQPIEHADGIVGEAGDGFQHRHGEDGATAERRQGLQVPRREPHSLSHQHATAIGVDFFEDRGADRQGPKPCELVGQSSQSTVPCKSRSLTCPGQDAERGAGLDLQQGLQRIALRIGEAGVDLPFHMALGVQQRSRHQTLDDTGSGCGDGAAA